MLCQHVFSRLTSIPLLQDSVVHVSQTGPCCLAKLLATGYAEGERSHESAQKMSLNTSLLMIKGDHLGQIEEIFRIFDYRSTGTVEHFEDWEDALEAAQDPRPGKSREIVHKPVFVHNGWTVILDLEGVLWVNEDGCANVSQMLGSSVFAMCCAGITCTYAYSLYDGKRIRAFWCDAEGGIIENPGDRLPEEDGLDLAEVGEEEVLKIMARLGVDYFGFDDLQAVQVHELTYSSMLSDTPATPGRQPPPPSQEGNKPWWKRLFGT